MSHEDVIKAFQKRDAEREAILEEAAESLIEEGLQAQTTSAIMLGELMQFAADDSTMTYEDFSKEMYDRLVEIAECYSRGA